MSFKVSSWLSRQEQVHFQIGFIATWNVSPRIESITFKEKTTIADNSDKKYGTSLFMVMHPCHETYFLDNMWTLVWTSMSSSSFAELGGGEARIKNKANSNTNMIRAQLEFLDRSSSFEMKMDGLKLCLSLMIKINPTTLICWES